MKLLRALEGPYGAYKASRSPYEVLKGPMRPGFQADGQDALRGCLADVICCFLVFLCFLGFLSGTSNCPQPLLGASGAWEPPRAPRGSQGLPDAKRAPGALGLPPSGAPGGSQAPSNGRGYLLVPYL